MLSRIRGDAAFGPTFLEVAKVTFSIKPVDPENVNNYSSVSVLLVFSKIHERKLYDQLYKNLKSINLFIDEQYRFQLFNSTEHSILQLVNDISSYFQKGEYTLEIFIELSKASYIVYHEIILYIRA